MKPILVVITAIVAFVNIVMVFMFATALWPAVAAFFMSYIIPEFLESANIQTSIHFGFWPLFLAFWGLFVTIRLLKK